MINKPQKDIKKPVPAPEDTSKPSFLSKLFKEPVDVAEAEAERDSRLGYTPRNTNKSASFVK